MALSPPSRCECGFDHCRSRRDSLAHLAHLAFYEVQIHVFKNAERYRDGNPGTALRRATDSAERALPIGLQAL